MPRTHVSGGLLTASPSGIVLGLDPSLTGFGFVALDPDRDLFEAWLYKSPNRGVERLKDIRTWLHEKSLTLVTAGFTILDAAVEDTVLASHSAIALGELSGLVRMFCLENLEASAQYPLKVPPSVVKKFATGRGNAKKSEVLLSVYKKWGVEFHDDNLADAYVLARVAAGDSSATYEEELVQKMRDAKFRDPVRV
jgi:crossover junction endodeoxyribonuclease RuvC